MPKIHKVTFRRKGVTIDCAEDAAWPAPIATASYTCTVVQQRTGTGYAAPGPAGSAATALSG